MTQSRSAWEAAAQAAQLRAQQERQDRQEAEAFRIRESQMRQRAEAAAMRREIEEMEARRWTAWEPMMLAFPASRTVRDDGWAAIGPCWGPDFEDIVLAAAGLAGKPGQRARLHEFVIRTYTGEAK